MGTQMIDKEQELPLTVQSKNSPFEKESGYRFEHQLTSMKVRLRYSTLALVLSFVAIGDASLNDELPEDKFVVLRASPTTMEHLEIIRELHDNMHEYDLDFWLTPHSIDHKADIMVRETGLSWLTNVLTNNSIPFLVTIPDVKQLILDREHKPLAPSSSFAKRLNDEGGNKARYGLGEYHSYNHIVSWMEDIQRNYPDKAMVITIGMTEEGRPIKGIKIGTGVYRTDKRVFWIDGGIHAREWAAVHTVAYVIDRLIADYDTDPLVRQAVDQLNFYIFPVLNPDGYEYSRSGVSPMIRLWRKNRSSMICKKDQWFRERCCGGVDLNRNFDWFWGEIGSSSDRCSEIYQGKSPFSESESRAVRDVMMSPELRGKVDAFLTLHTYSQMWIHPFSHQRKTVPEDISDIEQVGRKAIGALESVYGTKYRFGTGADILYPSSGGSDDWAKGKGGVKYVYLMELRPSEEVWDGFILDSRQLIPTGRETWAGIKVVIEAVLKLRRARIGTTRPAPPPPPPPPPPPTTTTIFTTTTSTTTTTTTPITTRAPVSTSPFFRRRQFRPSQVRPRVVVSAEARAAAIERYREQQARLDAMRQRIRTDSARNRQRGDVRSSSRRTSSTSTERPTVSNDTGGPRTCADRSPWCSAWMQRSARVCVISSIFMRRDCARTCRFC
nr:Proteinase inhibitor and Peptidase M14 and Metridin ShK toxin domain containing protein [Haemonchus contortus]